MNLPFPTKTRALSLLAILSLAGLYSLAASDSQPLEISGHATTGPGGWDVTVSARQDANGASGSVAVLGGATGPVRQIVPPGDSGCGCWCINARRTDTGPADGDQRINVYIRDVGDGVSTFDQFTLVSGIGIDCSFPIDDIFFQPFRQGDFTTSLGNNVAPVAIWVQPAEGSVFPEGASVILTAQATDSDGTVTFVDFFAGGTRVGRVDGPSADGVYNFTWANPPIGHVQVHAVAVDNAGARGISDAVGIFIGDGNPHALDLGTVEVSSIGHSFFNPRQGPLPPSMPSSVVDYLVDQGQNFGGGALLPSVSVNWDTNSQFSITVSAPRGQKILVHVPPGQPVAFGGSFWWESTRGGTSPQGSLTADFAGLEGTAPEFISGISVLADSHGFFGFANLESASVSNDFAFTSVTFTGTVTPQITGNGTENYVPHLGSSLVLYHPTSGTTDPGGFVSIVPVQSGDTPSGAIALLAQRISDSSYPSRIKRPLVSALTSGCDRLDRGQCADGVEILRAFQRKVAAQLGSRDPSMARQLINAAERIIDSIPTR